MKKLKYFKKSNDQFENSISHNLVDRPNNFIKLIWVSMQSADHQKILSDCREIDLWEISHPTGRFSIDSLLHCFAWTIENFTSNNVIDEYKNNVSETIFWLNDWRIDLRKNAEKLIIRNQNRFIIWVTYNF